MIIYGKNPVREFLQQPSSKITEVYVSSEIKRGDINDLIRLAERRGIKITYLSRESLSKTAGTSYHQGVAARLSDYEYVEVSQILSKAKERGENLLVVILDHLEDPQNFGAIIRSVYALGAHGIIIPKDRSVSVTPAVVKASAGTASSVSISMVTNIVRVLTGFKKGGIWIVGADPSAETSISDQDLWGLDIALVIGSEGKGLKRLVREGCDFLLSVPTIGELSLNASVAAGIMIYEIQMQRRRRKDK
ncbi:MAG: 23S rRNA (guanosine(2251)-2'-O)-methyltransferase RlmB [Deltaproteobacteria bacterium]|nr:23S rRNA (guanosine(2251)-2'-O)-methyltransferase RlmB [Deltaproteobacteria bacterium]